MNALSKVKGIIMKTVIIGASFAGVSCAMALKKWNKSAEVIVLDKQEVVPYVPNGLNWYFRQEIAELSDAKYMTNHSLDKFGIDYRLGSTVLDIDFLQKKLRYCRADKIETLTYDNVVLATGSSPKSRVIEGIESSRVVVTKGYEESLSARKVLETAKSLTIIGGGPIGIEASETYARLGKKVTLVEAGDSLDFKNVDKDMTLALESRMTSAGVTLKLSTRVRQIIDGGENVPLTIKSKDKEWQSDAVLLAINFRPQNELYQNDLECLVDGTIAVDAFMQTSIAGVYAIGDAIQLPFMDKDNSRYMPIVSHASRSAEIAAAHIMGQKTTILPSYKIIGHCHFGLYRGRIGLTEEELVFSHYTPRIYTYENQDFGHLEKHFIKLKLITDDETGQFLGMQCLSDYNCLELLNVMSVAMRSKLPFWEFVGQDFYYPVHHVNVVAELQKACQEMWIERVNHAD